MENGKSQLCSCFQEFLRIFFGMAVAKDCITSDQNFCARAHHITDGIERNTPIYLDAVIQPTVGTDLS